MFSNPTRQKRTRKCCPPEMKKVALDFATSPQKKVRNLCIQLRKERKSRQKLVPQIDTKNCDAFDFATEPLTQKRKTIDSCVQVRQDRKRQENTIDILHFFLTSCVWFRFPLPTLQKKKEKHLFKRDETEREKQMWVPKKMKKVVLDLAISSKVNARKLFSNWTRQKKTTKFVFPNWKKKNKLRCIRFRYLRETAAFDFGTPPFGLSPQGKILSLPVNSTK